MANDTGMHFVRIVPGDRGDYGPHRTQGTQVFVGDVKIDGVYRITMTADVNDVWHAVIECHAIAPELTAEGIITRKREGRIRRIWRRIIFKLRDITGLDSDHYRYER